MVSAFICQSLLLLCPALLVLLAWFYGINRWCIFTRALQQLHSRKGVGSEFLRVGIFSRDHIISCDYTITVSGTLQFFWLSIC